MDANTIKYTHRYIARIVLEAETALFVGSGETSLINDALVQKDHHGFPMIQGTSLMGVLRHALVDNDDEKKWEKFFGYQLTPKELKEREEKNKKKLKEDRMKKIESGFGSKVKISSAYFLFPGEKIAEGFSANDCSGYRKHFDNLPSRQHVRITHKGVGADKGLFENEVVYKGCRFIFEMEVKGDGSETGQWEALLKELNNPLFRIGQGTRNGYGKLSVKSCRQKIFDLTDKSDFDLYLGFNPSFNAPNVCLVEKEIPKLNGELTHYRLVLKPDAFFIFGSGYGDEQVDNTPFTEEVWDYKKGEIKPDKKHTVIPASSVKGAISHRTCFHYYKKRNELVKAGDKVYADHIDGDQFDELSKEYVGENNPAVAALFGVGGGKDKDSQRGRIIIDDLYYSDKEINNEKILNHVAIDRFTGGALDGALFSERVSQLEKPDSKIKLNIWAEKWKTHKDEKKEQLIEQAFEEALKDICRGLLPLGGMTTKGHGIFEGELYEIKYKKEVQADGKEKLIEEKIIIYPKPKNNKNETII